MPDTVYIWTDGGCRPNPGLGGWGALIRNDHGQDELWGGHFQTTNNRMEMTAVIRALEHLPDGQTVVLYTDSQYVKDGITKWIHGWKRKNWVTMARKPVANVDLWQEMDQQLARHHVTWQWVKGHSGHPENEYVDRLATRGIEETALRRSRD